MNLRLPLVLFAALAAFAIPAGSAFASPAGTFTAPVNGATISNGQTFTVDTNGVTGAAQVLFYDEETDPVTGSFARFEASGTETSPGSGIYTWQAQLGGWTNPTTGDNTPYAVTFDAVIANSGGTPIVTLYKTVTIDNNLAPLTVSSVAPAAGSTVSGTFTLSVTPSDPNNTVTSGDYSVQGGGTGTLLSDGNGHFTASIDTVADAIPNGDVYIDVHLVDAPGNQAHNAGLLHLVVQNPQPAAIILGTLIANKALYRTDETQLEVGDKVQAYGMEVSGYPTPTIHYLWNVCRGQVCNGITPGQDGLYTIQPADEGATLTLVATASNASYTDFATVDFGLIGPAYVEPTYVPAVDPTPEPTPAPTPTPTPTPAPVVAPVVVKQPVSTPLITPTEQKAINVAQTAVTADKTAVVKALAEVAAAKQSVIANRKKALASVAAVAAPSATATQKSHVVSTATNLVEVKASSAELIAAAKTAAAKAEAAKNAAAAAAKAEAAKQEAARKAFVSGKLTARQLATQTQLAADAKTLAAKKAAADAAAAAKQTAAEAAAVKNIAGADKKVDTALTVVSAGTATPSDKKHVVAAIRHLVAAQTIAADKADAAKASAEKLAAAKKKLAATKAAAVKP